MMTLFGADLAGAAPFAWPVDGPRYGAYLIVNLGLSATPGPAVLFSLATGIARGARQGVRGAFGISAGNFLWFTAAALGLGALVSAFPLVFRVIAYLGAAYIFWLSFGAFRAAWKGQGDLNPDGAGAKGDPFVNGLIVQILNPKALLFFVVILPPFLDLRHPVLPQLACFAVTAMATDLVFLSTYAAAGGMISTRFHDIRFRRAFMAMVGAMLAGAGAMVVARI